MIKINNLTKSFKENLVLNNLSLSIEEGSVFGLVGINGAGKSTLLRLIAGIYLPDTGSILVDDEENYENENVKSKIFFLPDEPFYSLGTTPRSLIDLYKAFYSFSTDEYLKYLEDFKIPVDKPLKNFSKGMKRQVFISLALTIKPKYLLLDEAFDGLDPLARLKFRKALANLVSENNTTVIISSHSLRELEDICDCYALLDNKCISSSGTIDDDTHKYHKYQLAFGNEMKSDDFNFEYKSIEIDKRIVKIITTDDLEAFEEKVKALSPLVIDEIPIDFEELFIIEVKERGYYNA